MVHTDCTPGSIYRFKITKQRFTPRFLINCLLYFIPTGWFEMILKSNGESIDEDIIDIHSEL